MPANPIGPSYSQLELEKIKLDITAYLSRENLQNANVYVDVIGSTAQTMAIRLRHEMWAHRTHTEQRQIYVQGWIRPEQIGESVLVGLRGPWWRKLGQIVAAWRGRLWCDVVGRAVVPAIEDKPIKVDGTAVQDVASFHTFPGATIPTYGPHLGQAVSYLQVDAPRYWRPKAVQEDLTPEQRAVVEDLLSRANAKVDDDE